MLHPFEPIFDEKSSVLILGTFPSIKSREYGFYYGHPQNRFWKIIAHITNTGSIPETIADKKQMLLKNGVALSDVLQSCDINGSSDSGIKNMVPMDLSEILTGSSIGHIYTNGEKAYQLFMKYIYKNVACEVTKLPSTSPANAQYNFEKLLLAWGVISSKEILKDPGFANEKCPGLGT